MTHAVAGKVIKLDLSSSSIKRGQKTEGLVRRGSVLLKKLFICFSSIDKVETVVLMTGLTKQLYIVHIDAEMSKTPLSFLLSFSLPTPLFFGRRLRPPVPRPALRPQRPRRRSCSRAEALASSNGRAYSRSSLYTRWAPQVQGKIVKLLFLASS